MKGIHLLSYLLLMNFFQVLNGIEGVSLANDICRNYRREGYYLMLISAVNPRAQKSSPPEGGELLCIKLV